jgi:hypothetical protein
MEQAVEPGLTNRTGYSAPIGLIFKGNGFEISYPWKEQIDYWEGDQGFRFDAAWGVHLGRLMVPSAEIWAEVMPAWLIGRRAEVVQRLAKHSGHEIAEDIHGIYRNDPNHRRLSRASGGQ